MSQNIIPFGAGAVSECRLVYFGADPNYKIVGVVVDNKYFELEF